MFKQITKSGLCLYCILSLAYADNAPVDEHYTGKGFFDIHVCNWPQRPLFLLALFSTKYFDDIKTIKIISPDDSLLGYLDLTKYRQFKTQHKELKKAFMKQFELPINPVDGWYKAEITLKDNSVLIAKDKVQHKTMPMAKVYSPENHAENINLPQKLSWNKIDTAGFYQVFIRDIWNDGKLIFQSTLLQQNFLAIPEGLLKKGGIYSWRIHVRDVNGDVISGDFNHGSLSPKLMFSIAE